MKYSYIVIEGFKEDITTSLEKLGEEWKIIYINDTWLDSKTCCLVVIVKRENVQN